MLEDILKIINRDGYISLTQIAGELNIPKEIVENGINQLIKLGYLQEAGAQDCSSFCGKCPFANNCHKEVSKSYQVTDKGNEYLQKLSQ